MRDLILGMTLVTVAASTLAAQAPAVPRLPVHSPIRIVAFGDSLTSGHRLPRAEAYPAVLEATLKGGGLPVVVANQGVSGDTSARGLTRLEKALAGDPQILILAFGANDGLRGVPVAQLRTNLAQMIEAAQARSVKVLLVGMEALPLYGFQYTLDFHRAFIDLAAKYQVPLVPFMLNGVIGNQELMTSDGIHPNAAGARVMAQNILPYVKALAEALASN